MASKEPDHEPREDEEAPVAEDEDTGAQVAPIVKLDEVAVSTGEENEDPMLDLKSKLYRFDKDGNQWKERGVGTVKLLKHQVTGKVRLVMRQSKTLKICANHLVLPTMTVQEHSGNDKSCLWRASDFADGELKDELFCIRFASVENCKAFVEMFQEVAKSQKLKEENEDGSAAAGLLEKLSIEEKKIEGKAQEEKAVAAKEETEGSQDVRVHNALGKIIPKNSSSMVKDQSPSVSEAVHKIQLHLLDGIEDEKQLLASGSLISRSDYEDVVTERSISNICGYPLCRNPLLSKPHRKGRYRISLKEHRVYDLQETNMFCFTDCLINSRAFAGSLQEERCSVLNHEKLNEILSLFGDLDLDDEGLGKNGDLGFSNLRIKEKGEIKAGEVLLVGPSNAIEGYVPQRELISKPSPSKISKNEVFASSISKLGNSKGDFFVNNEIDFTSATIMNNEYTISKNTSSFTQSQRMKLGSTKEYFVTNEMDFNCEIIMNDQYTVLKTPSGSRHSCFGSKVKEMEGKGICKDFEEKCLMSGSSSALREKDSSIVELPPTRNIYQSGLDTSAEAKKEAHANKAATSSETVLKSSLKSAGAKKLNLSITWADNKKVDNALNGNLYEVKEMDTLKGDPEICGSAEDGDDENMLRFVSAEACLALSKAAEAVAFGDSDVTDAVSEAGLIILPCPSEAEKKEPVKDVDVLEPETAPVKWPTKSGIPRSDMSDPKDSWFDAPPEGFSLTLSTFATMWNALFEWITSSSLAYIYGRDESFSEEYLTVNGREYPQKIVLQDGCSSKIKDTLAGCISRALPAIVTDLRLPIPISTLEQGLWRLLDTMSFMEALPAFRMKQWQVIILLFVDALSVSRIPALTAHMTNGRTLLYKVLDGAQLSMEEYEVMKDLIIPLGRAPHFSAQSGG
ncbi:putative RNA polymerase II subunit B1 CTD phosphatase RPAP2 homolog isoform X2 [Durio zibethinus]|uniref:RNA polymerase II subunit B1 CTD phosphatase RPAP2 homolog n=1 Tax=Durio zibethinus TaxID=66656 RepID=A0A6P5ZPD3_DURZI|nr:putative RNA polymerase II subunit B1 CTD phosphatase RPAP2 homolog isoform X2 [Durio zibethinus]